MKVDVIVGGERKELDLKGLRGRDVDKLIESLLALKDVAEDEMATELQKHRKLEKEFACTVSGLTIDELDDLDSDDRDKILDFVKAKVEKAIGFTMPSQR